MAKVCKTDTRQKTIFKRVKTLPAKLIAGTVYIVENNTGDFVDMYVADNQGNKKTIVDLERITDIIGEIPSPEEDLLLIDYRSDIDNIGTDYYYGYEYEDNSFKIIKVEKGNVVNQLTAVHITGDFDNNWNNRETLTYN